MDRIETRLEGYDGSYEVTGELVIALRGDERAEFERLVFAWMLYCREDERTMKELVLVLEGATVEVEKVIAHVEKDPKDEYQKEEKKKGKYPSRRYRLMLRLNDAALKRVLSTAMIDETTRVPFIMTGRERSSIVFDMTNYELVAVEPA